MNCSTSGLHCQIKCIISSCQSGHDDQHNDHDRECNAHQAEQYTKGTLAGILVVVIFIGIVLPEMSDVLSIKGAIETLTTNRIVICMDNAFDDDLKRRSTLCSCYAVAHRA
jgi:hypothetical protein